MMVGRAVALGLLLVSLAAPCRAAEDIWFFGAGFESPRAGQGHLADYNRTGLTLVAGGEHPIRGTTGVMMRLAYTDFPSNPGAFAQRFGTDTGAIHLGAAHLVSMVGGVRFRRRDLAISPYFDVGFGMAILSVERRFDYAFSGSASPSRVSSTWAFTWGSGVAWRVAERYGMFLDGHWDTVPGSPGDHSWTGALRAGVELR